MIGVGVDAHIDPYKESDKLEFEGERIATGASALAMTEKVVRRGDVVIGPYKAVRLVAFLTL